MVEQQIRVLKGIVGYQIVPYAIAVIAGAIGKNG